MRRPKGFALSLLLWAISMLFMSRALAHDEKVSTSRVTLDGRTLAWSVDVGLDGLRKALAFPDGEVTEETLDAVAPAISAYILGGVDIVADGRNLLGRARALQPLYEQSIVTGRPQIARIALQMQFEAETPIRSASAYVHFFSNLTAQHRALVRVTDGRDTREYVRLGPARFELTPEASQTSLTSLIGDFLRWGVYHIFTGYDHIAFLLGLLLATTRLRELVKVVTSFTLAHSVTILLSALDVIHLPSRITEAMIAASIVYIAIENLGRAPR